MATFVRTNPKLTNGGNFNKMAKANRKRKVDDSPFKKGKKKSIPLMMMMFKGYLLS